MNKPLSRHLLQNQLLIFLKQMQLSALLATYHHVYLKLLHLLYKERLQVLIAQALIHLRHRQVKLEKMLVALAFQVQL